MIYMAFEIEDGFPPKKLGEAFSKEWLIDKFNHINGILEILTEEQLNKL